MVLKILILTIYNMPVLTREVAQRFESEAQANYQKSLNRTEQEKKAEAEALERGFAKLRRMLKKASLDKNDSILFQSIVRLWLNLPGQDVLLL